MPGVERAAQCGDPHARLRQRPQDALQPRWTLVPPVPEQLGVVGRHHDRLATVPLPQRAQPGHDRVHEVLDVQAKRVRGERGIIGFLGVRRDLLAGDARGLEADLVGPGVEVAVVRVPGISRFRRPDPVGDLQVPAEAHDVGRPDRARGGRVAPQGRPVHQEAAHTGRRVALFHAWRVATFGRPDAGRTVPDAQPGVVETGAQREGPDARIEQRLERVCKRPAEQLDHRRVHKGP